jgi:hypothetical protein
MGRRKPISVWWRRGVFALTNGRCWYCGAPCYDEARTPTGEYEHQIPLSRGGLHAPPNVVLSCHGCNASKGSKTVEEFRAYLKGLQGVDSIAFFGEGSATQQRKAFKEQYKSDGLRPLPRASRLVLSRPNEQEARHVAVQSRRRK